MVDIADFRFTNVGDRYDAAYKRMGQFREDRGAMQAGNALKDGNYDAAAAELYGAGMLDAGQELQSRKRKLDADAASTERAARDERLKFAEGVAGRLSGFYSQTKDVNRLVAAYDQMAPQLQKYGAKPEEIAAERARLAQDPEGTLALMGAAIDEAKGIEYRSSGDEVLVYKNGNLLRRDRGSKTVPVAEGGALYELPGSYGSDAATPSGITLNPGINPDAPQSRGALTEPAPGGWLGGVAAAAPDAQVTSGLRTPQHNAQVGGKANSRHLTGEAVDLVPRPGETMGQLYARVSKVPGVRAINEGDHVHVQTTGQPAAQPAAGPRLLVQRPKAAKPQARPATPEEKAAYGVAPDVPAQIGPDGSFHVITGTAARLKAVPAAVGKGYTENNAATRQIDAAIALLKKRPGAMGLRNAMGDEITQRIDPDGIPVRGAVANIGSLIIHDRSGAAVTAAETPRLKPFIPMPTDTAEAAIKKLEGLRQQYQNTNTEIETTYGEDTGYAPLSGGSRAESAAGQVKVIRYDARGNRIK